MTESVLGTLFNLPETDTGPKSSFRWATVMGLDPLSIRFDGDTAAIAATPDSLVPVALDDRVWCHLYGRRVVILGVAQ